MTDDPFIDVIRATVEVLEAAGIEYAVTGSVAAACIMRPGFDAAR